MSWITQFMCINKFNCWCMSHTEWLVHNQLPMWGQLVCHLPHSTCPHIFMIVCSACWQNFSVVGYTQQMYSTSHLACIQEYEQNLEPGDGEDEWDEDEHGDDEHGDPEDNVEGMSNDCTCIIDHIYWHQCNILRLWRWTYWHQGHWHRPTDAFGWHHWWPSPLSSKLHQWASLPSANWEPAEYPLYWDRPLPFDIGWCSCYQWCPSASLLWSIPYHDGWHKWLLCAVPFQNGLGGCAMDQISLSINHCYEWAIGNWQCKFILFVVYITIAYHVPAEQQTWFVLPQFSGAPLYHGLPSTSSTSFWVSWCQNWGRHHDSPCLQHYIMHKGSLWWCCICSTSNFSTWMPLWNIGQSALSTLSRYAHWWLVVGGTSMCLRPFLNDWLMFLI